MMLVDIISNMVSLTMCDGVFLQHDVQISTHKGAELPVKMYASS